MAAGDVTVLPTGGIQFDQEMTAICGTTTTMYIGDAKGKVKSLTSAGVFADLTTPIKLNGRIVSINYISSSLIIVLADGRVYTCGTDGSSLTLVKNINQAVSAAYYYNSFLYIVLAGFEPSGTNFIKMATA